MSVAWHGKDIDVPGIGVSAYLPHELTQVRQVRDCLPRDEAGAVLRLLHEVKVLTGGGFDDDDETRKHWQDTHSRVLAERQEALPV